MKQRERRSFFIVMALAMLVFPLLGGYFSWGGLPPGFGDFPPQQGVPKPEFNIPYVIAIILLGIGICSLIIFPQLYGFKVGEKLTNEERNHGRLPIWFWLGLVVNLASWAAMWGQFSWLGEWVHYTFVPIWWGFICVLDGIVYYRTNGRSMFVTKPKTLFLLSATSAFLWFLFEYFNYFIVENWYYPVNDIFSPFGYRLWYAACYTTVWPAIFEFYDLFRTFPRLVHRYTSGPAFKVSKQAWIWMLVFGLALTFGFGLFPFFLFFGIWVGPMFITGAALGYAGSWNPLTPVEHGDWSCGMLFAISGVANAFFWEMWNYWSYPSNPSFWKYDIPYANVWHIFEMPGLGYLGYLPFGFSCLLLWLFIAEIFNWDDALDK